MYNPNNVSISLDSFPLPTSRTDGHYFELIAIQIWMEAIMVSFLLQTCNIIWIDKPCLQNSQWNDWKIMSLCRASMMVTSIRNEKSQCAMELTYTLKLQHPLQLWWHSSGADLTAQQYKSSWIQYNRSFRKLPLKVAKQGYDKTKIL